MQVSLGSNKYNIIDSRQVYLLNDEELTITIDTESDYKFTLIFKFFNVDLIEKRVDKKVMGNEMEIQCINFNKMGTGLMEPMSIAKVDGKEILLMFWSNVEGEQDEAQVRNIKYTIYIEK